MAAKGLTIASTEFPLYTIRVIGERHLLVAGGGGAVKTGICNAINIFELKRDDGDGKLLTARKVTHHETESHAIMNSAVAQQGKQFILATGVEGSCQIYMLHYKIITPRVENEVLEGLRKRKGNLTQSSDHRMANKMIGFDIEEVEKIVTDNSKDGGFQKVVQFSRDVSQFITAGADGYFRVWEYPSVKQVIEVAAHKNEIDDLDISPDGSKLVTVSKDNHTYLWNLKDGSKIVELTWPSDVVYRGRNCRFASSNIGSSTDITTASSSACYLYTTHIASVHNKRPDPAYIVKWAIGGEKGAIIRKLVNAGADILSALAVSDNGLYVAVGTISGSVSVYIAFNLQRLYHMSEIHHIFVTGMDFMPSSDIARSVAGDFDFTLFSISADNQVKVHQQERRDLAYNPIWAVIGAAILIFLLFWFITAFGL